MPIIIVQPYAHKPGHYTELTCRLANSLSERDIPVVVATYCGFIPDSTPDSENIKFKCYNFSSCTSLFKAFVVKVVFAILHPLSKFRILSRVGDIFETFLTLNFAQALQKDKNSDLLFCYDGELIGVLLFALLTKNQKIVYKLMDLSRTLRGDSLNRKIKRHIENRLCRIAMKRNSLIFIGNSSHLLRGYTDTGFPGICEYLSPIVNFERSDYVDKSIARKLLNLPETSTLLLVFGVGHGGKSFDTIIRAVQDRKGDYLIIFAGKTLTSVDNNPWELAKKYNCEHKLIILDEFIPADQVQYYFSSADCLILSYIKEFVSDSGVLLQGVGYNLPIIASDTGWIGETVREHNLGITFTPEDSKSLDCALTEFLEMGNNGRQALVRNVSTYATHLTNQGVTEEYIELIKRTRESI